MPKRMKTKKGKDNLYYPCTSPDLVIDDNGESQTTKNTSMKTDIDDIKADLGTETLNTTAKDIKSAVNELNTECKDIKKYVDDNTVIYPLPIHTTQEADKSITKIVNIMDLIPGVQYSTYKDINQTKTQGYRVVYICDDGTFKIICTLPVVNKIIHLLKVVHSTDYSTLSYNNTAYKVDYSKHSTDTDILITKTLQNYIPIANNIEYNPTREYHPTTKKYVDDKFICTDIIENVGIIPKEEMQKCNNGTSRYVSSIKFKEFFADYKHCIYQGMYGDKNIRMKYDAQYNRIIAYDLSDVIMLGFEFDNNYMYPFNAGTDEVKAYQFTNDLVVTKSPVLNPSEVYTNMDNSILEVYLNAETPSQSTNNLVIGKNYIITDSSINNECVSKSFSINFSNHNKDNQYLESILYFKTSGANNAITITPHCENGLTNILTEDGFDWTFSGYKYHILTFKKIRDMLFLTYNSYSILPG